MENGNYFYLNGFVNPYFLKNKTKMRTECCAETTISHQEAQKLTPHQCRPESLQSWCQGDSAGNWGGDKLNGETQWQKHEDSRGFSAERPLAGKYSPPWKSLTWCYKDVFHSLFPPKICSRKCVWHKNYLKIQLFKLFFKIIIYFCICVVFKKLIIHCKPKN